MSVLYAYTGPAADAARHLIANSALANVTTTTPDYPWAGENATKVELTTPCPSTGERLLWRFAEGLARDGEVCLDVTAAAAWLDGENRTALLVAFGIAVGIAAPVAVAS